MAKEPYDLDDTNETNEDTTHESNSDLNIPLDNSTDVYTNAPIEPKKKSKKKAFLFFVILIIALVIGYKYIVAKVFGPSKGAPTQMPVISAPKTEKITLAPPQPDRVSEQLSQLQKENQTLTESLKTAQDESKKNLTEIDQRIDQKIKSLNTDMANLQESLNQLQKDFKDVYVKLEQKLEQSSAGVQTLLKRQKLSKQQREQNLRERKKYYVKAVIPGRAWVADADGVATTVAVGDDVPGYGKITAINSYSGTISTSSGLDIQYAVSEK